MLSGRFVTALARVGCALPVLALAIALLPWMFGPPVVIGAEPPDPAARLQVAITSAYILDDRDLTGSGELLLVTRFVRGSDSTDLCSHGDSRAFLAHSFDASSGDTIPLELLLPVAGDPLLAADDGSGETGVPVYAGQQYRLCFFIVDRDVWNPSEDPLPPWPVGAEDTLGEIVRQVDEEHGWDIGTHTVSSSKTDCSRVVSLFPPQTEVGPCYELTFEIRRTPLPDLHPTSIELLRTPGGGENVCLGVENLGQQDAGPFEMVFRVDDQDVPGGTVAAGRLAAGQSGKLCLPATLPRGQHTLSASVDEARSVPEMDESNNRYVREVVLLNRPPLDRPPLDRPVVGEAKPPPPPADLVVSSVKVARQADGSGTCQGDQLNYLFAQLMNVGPGPAGEFAVRLAVGGSLKQEKVYVQGLEPNETIEVRFATDDLNAGSQAVQAIADGDEQVAEQDEANNALEITATCD